MNRKVTEELIRKNKWYIDTLNSTSVKKNNILKDRFIVQINISRTRRIPQTNTLMYEIVRMDKNLLVEDVYNNEIIYDINLEYLEEELYNKGKLNKEEKRLLLFIERNKKKLNKMFEGDLKMKDTLNNLDEVGEFDDISFALEYDKELLDERIQAELVEKAEEKGKKETAIEIAKKLLKSNVSIENINKITELPIEEIEKIQEDKEFGDISFALEYDKEALDEQINKEWMEEEIKEGIEKGIEERLQTIQQEVEQEIKQKVEQSSKNTSINIVKGMIKEGLALEQISRITKISIEELKKI